jgi:general stress protein YciG
MICFAVPTIIAKKLREEEMAEKGSMTVKEAGKKGGRATKSRYGPEFYERIGRMGGQTTKSRHGPLFYQKIGSLGGQRVRALVAQGKKAAKSR